MASPPRFSSITGSPTTSAPVSPGEKAARPVPMQTPGEVDADDEEQRNLRRLQLLARHRQRLAASMTPSELKRWAASASAAPTPPHRAAHAIQGGSTSSSDTSDTSSGVMTSPTDRTNDSSLSEGGGSCEDEAPGALPSHGVSRSSRQRDSRQAIGDRNQAPSPSSTPHRTAHVRRGVASPGLVAGVSSRRPLSTSARPGLTARRSTASVQLRSGSISVTLGSIDESLHEDEMFQ